MSHNQLARQLLVLTLLAIFVISDMYVATVAGLALALILLWAVSGCVVVAVLLGAKDEPEYDPTFEELRAARALRPCGNVERTWEREEAA